MFTFLRQWYKNRQLMAVIHRRRGVKPIYSYVYAILSWQIFCFAIYQALKSRVPEDKHEQELYLASKAKPDEDMTFVRFSGFKHLGTTVEKPITVEADE